MKMTDTNTNNEDYYTQLQEKFQKIGVFSGIPIFDSRHAIAELKKWFPNVTEYDYKDVLNKGITKILKTYGRETSNYMVISKKFGFRIPLEIREDNKNKGFTIGVTPTTLAKHETKNLRNEIELFIEKNGYAYRQFKLTEGFNYFTDKSKVIQDFDEVSV